MAVPKKVPMLAKVALPNASEAMPRPRLFAVLDAARERPVVWIAGPGGAGKTTLVASYVAARRPGVTWYRLGEEDVDVASFFYYFGLAAAPSLGTSEPALPLFTPEYALGLRAFTRTYFERFFSRVETPFVWVLDDFHELPAGAPLRAVIRDAAAVVPPGVNVIILSREDAAVELAPLRARGEMSVLGWDALRFTTDESMGVARRRVGTEDLVATDIEAICRDANGWAAGLTLLLEHARSIGPAPVGLSGEQSGIFDYFASEVLATSEPEVRRFMLEVSFLPSMTAAIAAEVTGIARAGKILARLHRHNLFTERHGGGAEPIYRFHDLFRAFLQDRAQEDVPPERAAEIGRKAATLLASAGQVDDAVELLARSRDFQGLVGLCLEQAAALVAQGRSRTLEGWLSRIPPALARTIPWCGFWGGVCRMFDRPDEARSLLERAFEAFGERGEAAGQYLSWAAYVDATCIEFSDMGALEPWMARFEELRARHPEFPDPVVELRVACAVHGWYALYRGAQPEAREWGDRARHLALAAGDMAAWLQVSAQMVVLAGLSGEPVRASIIVDEIAQLAGSVDVPAVQINARIALAMSCLGSGRTGEMRAAAEEGLAIGRASGVEIFTESLLAMGAAATLSAGDLAAARGFLERMGAGEHQREFDRVQFHYYSSWAALIEGDLAVALGQIRTAHEVMPRLGFPHAIAFNRLAMAQILHEMGRDDDAGGEIAEGLRIGERVGSHLIEFMGLVILADLLFAAGDAAQAEERLRAAFAIGRAHGLVMTPFFRPAMMGHLGVRALDAGIEPEYAVALARRWSLPPGDGAAVHEDWPWKLKVRTLGRVVIERDGEELRFQGKVPRKPLELLATLVALGGEAVAQEEIADALWPDADGDQGLRNLEMTLLRLRRLLGEDRAIVLSGGKLTLDPAVVWTDVRALTLLLSRLDDLLRRPLEAGEAGAERLVRSCTRALALYRGDFLSGLTDLGIGGRLRDRLRTRLVRALDRAARACEAAKEIASARRCYELAVATLGEVDVLVQGRSRCTAAEARR